MTFADAVRFPLARRWLTVGDPTTPACGASITGDANSKIEPA